MLASSNRTVLMPTLDTTLNVLGTTTATITNDRKRKRADTHSRTPTNDTFVATLLHSSTTPQSYTFARTVSLQRSSLPLIWLCPKTSTAGIPAGAQVQSQSSIAIDGMVQVARLLPNGGLYVLEKITSNTSVVFPLQSSVSEQQCREAAQAQLISTVSVKVASEQKTHSRTVSCSSNNGILPGPPSPKRPNNRRGALARMSILTQREDSGKDESNVFVDSPVDIGTTPMLLIAPSKSVTALPVTPAAQLHPQNPFDDHEPASAPATLIQAGMNTDIQGPLDQPSINKQPLIVQLRQQYYETLYLSKTSLAFFVKGPLNRARAQVQASTSETSIEQLSELYDQLVLPTKKFDIKYKESVMKTIQLFVSSGNGKSKSRKSNTKKKLKLGKDGLWSDEDDYIQRWWFERDFNGSVANSSEAQVEEMKKVISDLRSREAEMQLMLILELILLEKLPEKSITHNPDIKVESIEEDSVAITSKSLQQKKKRNLQSELETILDRLCIWHTIGFDDLLSSPDKSHTDSGSMVKSKDKLHDFCSNIIVPFYASKLRDQCKLICRKLGVSQMSPDRSKAQSSRRTARPASAMNIRSQPQLVTKQSLERVLSEDQAIRHNSPPILMRSATAPVLPKIKREPSELALPPPRPTNRGAMHKSVSFSNREIDLVSDAKVQEARLKKLDRLATQKRELDAAIDALKKPNRTSLAKAFMDEVEERVKVGTKLAVQITATPKKAKDRRFFDQEEPELPPIRFHEDNFAIPSSTVKPRSGSGIVSLNSNPKAYTIGSTVTETPSRGHQKRSSNPLNLPSFATDGVSVAATPSISHLRPDLPSSGHRSTSSATTGAGLSTPLRMIKSQRPVLLTPLPKTAVSMENVFRDAPVIPEQAGKAMDRVMGGKSMIGGLDETFEFGEKLPLSSSARSEPKMLWTSAKLDVQDLFDKHTKKVEALPEQRNKPNHKKNENDMNRNKSIYDQLGWNDDFDDI